MGEQSAGKRWAQPFQGASSTHLDYQAPPPAAYLELLQQEKAAVKVACLP
jgi:hypothetical protein